MSKEIIEAEVEVISSKKSQSSTRSSADTAQSTQSTDPFSEFPEGGGVPDFASMFESGGMPDLSKMPGIPLKQRIIFKFMSLLSSPKLRFLKSKWSIPVWGVLGIFVLAGVLLLAVVFSVTKLLKAIFEPYLRLMNRK